MSLLSRLAGLALPPPINWIATGLGWIGKAVGALLKLAYRHPREAVIVVLLIVAALQWRTIDHTKHTLGLFRTALTTCQTARKAEKGAVATAQRAALAKALAAKARHEATYRTIAKGIDDHANTDLAAAHDAARRYADAHRLPARPTVDFASGSGAATGDPGPDSAGTRRSVPQLDAGGGVLVSERDIRICTDNTVAGHAGHELATQLHAASADPATGANTR